MTTAEPLLDPAHSQSVEPPGLTLIQVPPLPKTPLSFDELAATWLESRRRNIKASSRAAYAVKFRTQISPTLGELEVSTMTASDLTELLEQMLATGYSATTIRDAFTLTRSVLNYGVRHGFIASNPATLIPGRERPRVTRHRSRILSPAEITQLLDAAPEPYRTLFAVGIFAGLRSGELRGLQWHDIDLPNRRLRVRRQADPDGGNLVPPKTDNAIRDVILLDPLPELLVQHRARQNNPKPDDCIFTSKGRPFRAARLCYKLRRIAAEAGIEQRPGDPAIRIHDLRHTCASLMIAARADIAFVSRQLGHANASVTLGIYTHLFDEAGNVNRVRNYVDDQFGDLAANLTPSKP